MILHPVTPAALQPNPMQVVNACLPQALHRLNLSSKLKATLGRYPESSKSVNIGKNIAMGGSITAIIHVNTQYTPSINNPLNQFGALHTKNNLCR